MNCFDLFPTKLWMGKLDLDIPKVMDNLDDLSNYDELSQSIMGNMPNPNGIDVLPETYIHYWVNFNRPGDSNPRHDHTDHVILYSGVYYLKVPPNSGRILFSDPRGLTINSMADARYYGYEPDISIDPEPGMVVYFPSWLEHEVEKNEGNSERVSIAFNIVSACEIERYKAMDSKFKMRAINVTGTESSAGANDYKEFFST